LDNWNAVFIREDISIETFLHGVEKAWDVCSYHLYEGFPNMLLPIYANKDGSSSIAVPKNIYAAQDCVCDPYNAILQPP
jgi:hypothetical protein